MWNLFEKIINAIRPTEKPQQPSDESQSWTESTTEQSENPQEPVSVAQQNQWQDSEQS